jgi:hypothetical protein
MLTKYNLGGFQKLEKDKVKPLDSARHRHELLYFPLALTCSPVLHILQWDRSLCLRILICGSFVRFVGELAYEPPNAQGPEPNFAVVDA